MLWEAGTLKNPAVEALYECALVMQKDLPG
jgi:hypothetical protein